MQLLRHGSRRASAQPLPLQQPSGSMPAVRGDRPGRTLSAGELRRVTMARTLGAGLVNTLYVLDEPTIGLHHHEVARLVVVLEELRDAGNTLVVVENEGDLIRAADHVVDLGPG